MILKSRKILNKFVDINKGTLWTPLNQSNSYCFIESDFQNEILKDLLNILKTDLNWVNIYKNKNVYNSLLGPEKLNVIFPLKAGHFIIKKQQYSSHWFW